jgi:hypothetical protein
MSAPFEMEKANLRAGVKMFEAIAIKHRRGKEILLNVIFS